MVRPTLTSSQTVGPSITATGPCRSNAIYVEIPSLKLDDADHTSLHVDSVQYGFDNTATVAGPGAGAGKATFEPLAIGRPVDAFSIQTFRALTTGTHFEDVIVEYKGTDYTGKSLTCATADFRKVYPVKQEHTASAESVTPSEGLTLIYGADSVNSVPTLARVSAFVAFRTGQRMAFTWRLAHTSQVAGFDLYAGRHRVNSHLIHVHRAASYHYSVRWSGHGAFSLHLLLNSGAQLVVPAQ